MMDDDGSNTISLPEFTKVVRDFKLGISDENVPILFSKFDTSGDGTLNFNELINTVREPLTPARRQQIEEVFKNIDKNQNGVLNLEEIKASFNVRRHPDVMQGKRTEQTVLNEFIETLEAHHSIYNDEQADG
mmetsp:Transcript_5510/g.9369  ORF Transcript_5510/g.9369 Transcript_5510/m.9369 type:complete len:132 (-) Transcript_5510:2093-2488(-)